MARLSKRPARSIMHMGSMGRVYGKKDIYTKYREGHISYRSYMKIHIEQQILRQA